MVGRRGKETLGRCCQLLHYQVPYIGQCSFGVAYASLGKSEPCHAQSVGEFVTLLGQPLEALVMLMHDLVGLCACLSPRQCHSQYWQTLRGNSIGGCSVLHASNCRAALLFNVLPFVAVEPKGCDRDPCVAYLNRWNFGCIRHPLSVK
ncbi:hypothetical protein V6N13_024444 [Hibiscus sabdariffa]